MSTDLRESVAGALQKPRRNRYFYGKHLDVRHFELEQDYFNSKRWLLNRLVSGIGVVCGLNVLWEDNNKKDAIIVKPGLAIDKWGREIVVAQDSAAYSIKQPALPTGAEQEKAQDERFIQVCIDYHECESEPAPVLESECNGGQRCMPDTIHERYKLITFHGRAPEMDHHCQIPDVTNDETGQIDYEVLCKWVSERCAPRSPESCIPLAEIGIDENGYGIGINICVRPIVYTNDLLYEMILALSEHEPSDRPGRKY